MSIPNGIIVSIQGYSYQTTIEMAKEVISAGAVAIRTDKDIDMPHTPVIGLQKNKVEGPDVPYITTTIEQVDAVNSWANYVAIDYRKNNEYLKTLSEYCQENKIKVVADIMCIDDYKNIKKHRYHYDYIATTLSVFKNNFKFNPDVFLVKYLKDSGEKNIIAEGNYTRRAQIKEAYKYCDNICIGHAITGIYKLTRKFTTI